MHHSTWVIYSFHTFLTEEAMLANTVPGWLGVREGEEEKGEGVWCWMCSKNMTCLKEDVFMRPIVLPSECMPIYFKAFRCMWGFTSLLTVQQGFHWGRDRMNHALSLLPFMYLTLCLSRESQIFEQMRIRAVGLCLTWFGLVLFCTGYQT